MSWSSSVENDYVMVHLESEFAIDIETCAACCGTMRIIACIEDPMVIKAILAHLAGKTRPVHAPR